MPRSVNSPTVAIFDESHDGDLSLAERAYRAIRDMLVTLQIRPGEPLQEELLTQQLGVGRTPVREAIKRLETERLVLIYPRRGTFASEVNIMDLALISEVRLQLEPHAARLAAQRATAHDRAGLGDLLEEVPADGDTDADRLMRLDMRVHRTVYRCTHNAYLEGTLLQYHNLATRIWYLFVDRLTGISDHVAEHGPLLEAIAAGDGDRAGKLAADHVAGFEEAVRSII